MSSIQSLISKIANLSAKAQILQDKVTNSGIAKSLDLIDDKFSQFGLDSIEAKSLYEQAQESTFTKIELEKLNADQELLDQLGFEESNNWERFRGSYEG